MKLALISATFPYGGKEPYLLAELQALAPFFESITVFPTLPQASDVSFSGMPAQLERRGLIAPRTCLDALAAIATRPRQSFAAVKALMFRPYRIKVKLKNVSIIPVGLGLGFRLRRDGFDHVHSYWLSTPASVAFLAATVAGIPWSSTAHLWDIYENNALETKLMSARFIRAISERGQHDLLATSGCANAPVTVLHVGVEVPPIVVEHKNATRPFAILCAANLVYKKGHAVLLSALSTLRKGGVSFRCTLAGDGELRDVLGSKVQALGLDEFVTFRGHVSHATLIEEIAAGSYDAMVLASVERSGGLMEGIPVALMEAMALGLPVITTASGSITELVDETSGRVVPQDDASALAAAIEQLSKEPSLCARLALSAHQRVTADFNVRQVARKLAELMGARRPTDR